MLELGPPVNLSSPWLFNPNRHGLQSLSLTYVWSLQGMENGQGHIYNHLQFFLVYNCQRTNTISGFCAHLEKMTNPFAYNQTNTTSPRAHAN